MYYEDWFNLGCTRIDNILNRYHACTERQFEMKIAEAGPTNQRVEPIILSNCINYKEDMGEIVRDYICVEGQNIKLYTFPDIDGRKLSPRKKKLTIAQTIYNKAAREQKFCGNVLEYIIGQAIQESQQFITILPALENTDRGIKVISGKDNEMKYFDGKNVHGDKPLDGILIHKSTSIPIGIEIKNKREWKYPSDYEIWHAIAKCASLDIFPVFIARKIPKITQFFFARAGILGLETQFQFFHSSQKSKMEDVIHKKCLGYADIKFSEKPLAHMIKFFEKNIPQNIEPYYERFLQNKDILFEYATNKKLAQKSFNGAYRNKTYSKINKILAERINTEVSPDEDEVVVKI